jgi:4-aminobutyrate aminotransferase-like enzyme
VDGLRQRGVLAGLDGPHNNVVKMRPPMVFDRDHADLLLQRMDETLKAV